MSYYAKEIKSILATLNEHGDEGDTPLPDEEELDTIHVYPVEGGGLLLTRTPIEDEPAVPVIDSQDNRPTTGVPRQTPPPLVLFLLLLCVFVLGDMADAQLIALMTPTATIAITPKVHTVRLQSTATLGKLLSPITLSQSQTVPATGHGHQDARAATGTLTFYNGELQPVTLAAGTILTGRDGIQVATTQGVVIPTADPTTTPPTFGQVSVAAQAVQVGAAGNIAAFDVSGTCCAASVLVKNLTPFVQGQDARDFLLVTKTDRDSAAATLQAKVTASMSAALQGQLLSGQALHTLPCSPAITADHTPGEEAASLTVTVSETCTAVAYDMQQLQARATQLLTTQATRSEGAGYLLAGNVQVNVGKAVASPTSPQVVLSFTCAGTFAYTLTAQIQQHLKTLLAGQPRLSALRWLLQQSGIQSASISGIADNRPLPDDLGHIHLLIVVLLF
jgi:Baseplate J-like protein